MKTATFSKKAKQLKEAGLIQEVPIKRYVQSGVLKILVPTKEGYAYLEKCHFKYPPIKGNGSIKHRYWQYRIWKKESTKNEIGGIECSIKEKRVDVGIIRPYKKFAYEVVVEDLKKEVNNLKKDLAEGWDVVIFCVGQKAPAS